MDYSSMPQFYPTKLKSNKKRRNICYNKKQIKKQNQALITTIDKDIKRTSR